ncbi:MAG TPA: hypothetical protein VFX48_03645, partial [Saprospiraceae bacterium]|nr:hypothetical protein [Saprospiraceae bacterium]
TRPCNAGETYEFDYNWFRKSDPTKIISKEERLLVQASAEDYAIQVNVITTIDAEVALCTKTFYESIDEGNISPECFPLAGEPVYCFDQISEFRIDTLLTKNVMAYTWSVVGGQIISNPDSSAVKILWSLNPGDTGKVCASYSVDCGSSCIQCRSVVLDQRIAGPDFSQRGLSAYLNALGHPDGIWTFLSGPHTVRIDEPKNPKTRISAYNYGVYCFEWAITGANCTVRDTLCVELYHGRRASPEYPDPRFEFGRLHSGQDQLKGLEVVTSNLIRTTGTTTIKLIGQTGSLIQCTWFDLYGRRVQSEQVPGNPEGDDQRFNINAPIGNGIYLLQIYSEGSYGIKKVLVME